MNNIPGSDFLPAGADVLIEGEVIDAVVLDDVEDRLVRDAVRLLGGVGVNGDHAAQGLQAEQARAAVLDRFARADVHPELPTLIAGIGNLYECGYDMAAEHIEMAHWGLRHDLVPAGALSIRPA